MKKTFFTFLLALVLVFISTGGVDAQSISGDGLCGASSSTACGVDDFKKLVKGVFSLVIGLGMPILLVVVVYLFVVAWFQKEQGNAAALQEARKRAVSAVVGFLIIVALFGGVLLVIFNYIGVGDDFLKLIKLVIDSLVPHAYAQSDAALPVPTGEQTLYDYIMKFLGAVMRFFIYPALIVMWVWTGFAFVLAQGNPEAISKAKKRLVLTFVITIIIFALQTFLLALKGTVEEILPGTTQLIEKGGEMV